MMYGQIMRNAIQLFLKVFQEIIEDIEDSIWPGYTRQLSLYGYLLKNNNLEIGNFGIIAVINTEDDLDYSSLNFKFYLFKRNLNLDWIEGTLSEIKILLENDDFPEVSNGCKFCNYINNLNNLKK